MAVNVHPVAFEHSVGPSQDGETTRARHFRYHTGYKEQDFRFRSFPAVTTSLREHACEFLGPGFDRELALVSALSTFANCGSYMVHIYALRLLGQ